MTIPKEDWLTNSPNCFVDTLADGVLATYLDEGHEDWQHMLGTDWADNFCDSVVGCLPAEVCLMIIKRAPTTKPLYYNGEDVVLLTIEHLATVGAEQALAYLRYWARDALAELCMDIARHK